MPNQVESKIKNKPKPTNKQNAYKEGRSKQAFPDENLGVF